MKPDRKNNPLLENDSLLEKKSGTPTCSCMQDPFAALPPDLQPQKKSWKTGFRQVTCPGCGLEYWTNCEGDFCTDCTQKKGRSS